MAELAEIVIKYFHTVGYNMNASLSIPAVGRSRRIACRRCNRCQEVVLWWLFAALRTIMHIRNDNWH